MLGQGVGALNKGGGLEKKSGYFALAEYVISRHISRCTFSPPQEAAKQFCDSWI